jgi:hypothetical protein
LQAELAKLWEIARRQGWAGGAARSIDSIRTTARLLGWTEVATRKGDSTVSELRPTEQAKAAPRSLSATHGLGEQPLHTDGAHLRKSPDAVVLQLA